MDTETLRSVSALLAEIETAQQSPDDNPFLLFWRMDARDLDGAIWQLPGNEMILEFSVLPATVPPFDPGNTEEVFPFDHEFDEDRDDIDEWEAERDRLEAISGGAPLTESEQLIYEDWYGDGGGNSDARTYAVWRFPLPGATDAFGFLISERSQGEVMDEFTDAAGPFFSRDAVVAALTDPKRFHPTLHSGEIDFLNWPDNELRAAFEASRRDASRERREGLS